MGIMFVIFLWIGIRSFGQIKQLKDATATEDALQDEILKWFLDTYRADVIDQSVDNDQPEEALYLSLLHISEERPRRVRLIYPLVLFWRKRTGMR